MGANKNQGGIFMSNLACIDDAKIWTYEDLLKFGGFSRCFELIEGELYYKPE